MKSFQLFKQKTVLVNKYFLINETQNCNYFYAKIRETFQVKKGPSYSKDFGNTGLYLTYNLLKTLICSWAIFIMCANRMYLCECTCYEPATMLKRFH